MMTSQVAQWFRTLTSGKCNSWRETVKFYTLFRSKLAQNRTILAAHIYIAHKKGVLLPSVHQCFRVNFSEEADKRGTLNYLSFKKPQPLESISVLARGLDS